MLTYWRSGEQTRWGSEEGDLSTTGSELENGGKMNYVELKDYNVKRFGGPSDNEFNRSYAYAWEYSNIATFLREHVAVMQPTPTHITLNAGLWAHRTLT